MQRTIFLLFGAAAFIGSAEAQAQTTPGLLERIGVPEKAVAPRNPTLTAQALAWRTAEYLVKNWKSINGNAGTVG